jgi:RNA polymerase sigma-70 factor (ECF subfamily)
MQPHSSDTELINRAKAADPSALSQIYERYSPAIYRYIFYRVRDPELAEDLRAEVFLRMLEGMDRYEDRGWPISAWLYRIARDRTIDTLRRKYRRTQLPLEEWSETCEGPDLILSVQLDYEELRESIDLLTESQRQVILLRFMGELSVQEVAKRLGRTEGAVKALQHRGLQTLARILRSNTVPQHAAA